MSTAGGSGMKLGINGFGRIGKLSVWHHVARRYFAELVVNIGRQAGSSIEDIAHYVERDSTYGWLHGYLFGHRGQPVITDLNETDGSMMIDSNSIFRDLEFCQTDGDGGIYTLDAFGGVFALGSTREDPVGSPAPMAAFTNGPYFYPNLYAEDLENTLQSPLIK